jgi:hypothetical protein
MFSDFKVSTILEPSQEKKDEAIASGKTALNYVGSSDGDIIFKFKPTKNFPIYGGKMIITVPNWYSGNKPESTA